MNCLTSVQSGCFQEAGGDYYKIGSKVIYDKAEIQAWPQLQLTSEVLICDAKMREYFVKLEIISKPNSLTICISFHKAEHPMSYHLKNKSEQEYQRIRKKVEAADGDYKPIGQPPEYTGFRSLSPDKVANVVRHIISNIGSTFVTKMNKLLFYTDFIHYKIQTIFSTSQNLAPLKKSVRCFQI